MRVFLSHSSRDKPLIRELTGHLPAHIRMWIDERALLIGDDIESSIRQSIGKDVDLVLIFIGRDSVASEWVRKELAWALERESEIGHTFVLPVVLDEDAWQLIEPAAFRRRKYIKCIDYSESGIKATAEALKDDLFAFASRRIEPVKETSTEADKPKSMAESMAGVFDVYHGMATKKIKKSEREFIQEIELTDLSTGKAGVDQVIAHLNNKISQLREEEQSHSQKADELRTELASNPDKEKKNFMSTIGLMIEGASISAKVTATHFEELRDQFRLLSKKNPDLNHIDNLRSAITQLERKSMDSGDAYRDRDTPHRAPLPGE